MPEEHQKGPTTREQFEKKAALFLAASAQNRSMPREEMYMMGNLLISIAPHELQSSVDGKCRMINDTYDRNPEMAVHALAGLIQEARDREATTQWYTELKFRILGAERSDAVTVDELKRMGEFLISQKGKPEMKEKLKSKLEGIYALYNSDFAEAITQMGELVRANDGREHQKNGDPGKLAAWLEIFRGKRKSS